MFPFLAFAAALDSVGASKSDVAFVHLYVADISHFGCVNEVYESYFGVVRPPSRSCVQVPLGKDCSIALDCVFHCTPADRSVLHVSSTSKWAPLCIGPYCQCNEVTQLPCVVFTCTIC